MTFLIWGALIIAVIFYLYQRQKKCHSYWEKRGIPSAPTLPFVGSILSMFKASLHEVDMEMYKKYGRLYGQYVGTRPALTVADPELLKNILVKDFPFFTNRASLQIGDPYLDSMVSSTNGETWKRIRSLMTPAFTTGKIKKMVNIIFDCANTVCDNFEKQAKSGEPADAKRLFGAFTMDVIASVAFGIKVDSHNNPDNKFVTVARKAFQRNIPIRFVLFLLFPSIFRLLKLPIFDSRWTNFFKSVILTVIEERRKTGQIRNDFLQLMLEANDEQIKSLTKEEADEAGEVIQTVTDTSTSGKGLSHHEVVAQCILFFFAGYDTTASTLSFAAYSLALNPDVQEKLIAEIDAVVEESKGHLTYERIQSMKYLDSVVSETLRMFPPVVRLDREAVDDYVLDGTGLIIPKGMPVGVPVYAMHHDPEFYPDPETFNPDRFSPEEKAKRNPYTYLPFGAGPRNCLAMRFALMEVKLCLAAFFRKFRVKRIPETQVPIQYYVGEGLLLPKEILLGIQIRTDARQ